MRTVISRTRYFTPAKSPYFPLTYGILTFTIALIIYFGGKADQWQLSFIDWAAIVIWLLSLGYYLWQWTNTWYAIKENSLYYQSGFTKGSLPVSSIRKIETNSRAWGNIQVALTFKGMMVTYNKWDEVFIAPKEQKSFLQELFKLNPEIVVIDWSGKAAN